jgi:hypothetical protein
MVKEESMRSESLRTILALQQLPQFLPAIEDRTTTNPTAIHVLTGARVSAYLNTAEAFEPLCARLVIQFSETNSIEVIAHLYLDLQIIEAARWYKDSPYPRGNDEADISRIASRLHLDLLARYDLVD